MLGHERRRLVFPRLIDCGSNDKYILDWSVFDIASCVLVQAAQQVPPKTSLLDYCWADASSWNSWLTTKFYVVSQPVRAEIRRCVKTAVLEWERHIANPYPKSIRHNLYLGAEGLIRTAFFLLSDCAVDPESNQYDRGPTRPLLLPCLLLRFWEHQASSGSRALRLSEIFSPLLSAETTKAAEKRQLAHLRHCVGEQMKELRMDCDLVAEVGDA